MNAAFQLSGLFWNYALSVRDGKADRKIEKGDLNNPVRITARIDKIEPYFIDVLKHQFS